jgi:hypothetical protein
LNQMGQGIFGGYEQDLRSQGRDMRLAAELGSVDELQNIGEQALYGDQLAPFFGTTPEMLAAGLASGIDIPGMQYGTSEREAAQDFTAQQAAIDRGISGDQDALNNAIEWARLAESARQFDTGFDQVSAAQAAQNALSYAGLSQDAYQFGRGFDEMSAAQIAQNALAEAGLAEDQRQFGELSAAQIVQNALAEAGLAEDTRQFDSSLAEDTRQFDLDAEFREKQFDWQVNMDTAELALAGEKVNAEGIGMVENLIQLAADPAFAEFDIPDMIEDINDHIFDYGRTKLTNENVAFGLMEIDSEEALALLQILYSMQDGMIDPMGGLSDPDLSAPPVVNTADMEIVSGTAPTSDYSEAYRATGDFVVDQNMKLRVGLYENDGGAWNPNTYEKYIDSQTGLGISGTIFEGMTLGQILGERQSLPTLSSLYEFQKQASPYIGSGGGASPSAG